MVRSWIWRLRSRWQYLNCLAAEGDIDKLLKESRGNAILVYHGISTVKEDRYNSRFTSIAKLEKQLSFFARYFNLVDLSQIVEKNTKSDRFNLAITFDDGYLNNYRHVRSILLRKQIPATFFVTGYSFYGREILWTDLLDIYKSDFSMPISVGDKEFSARKLRFWQYFTYVGNDGKPLVDYLNKSAPDRRIELENYLLGKLNLQQIEDTWEYWKLMSLTHLIDLHKDSLFTIGLHSEAHDRLSSLSVSDARKDVEKCYALATSFLGEVPLYFAYPEGYADDKLVEITRNAGFSGQFMADVNSPVIGRYEDVFGRMTCNPYCGNAHQATAIVLGKY